MKYLTSLKNNIWTTFLIFSIPSFFINSFLRMMNLNEIETERNSKEIIIETIKKLSPFVFILSCTIDAMRQQIMYKKIIFIDSLMLGFKFYITSIFWKIGYELSLNKNKNVRAFRSGVGTSYGLMLSSLITLGGKYFDTALGISIKGFFEGFVCSRISDLNLYKKYGKLLDILSVGLTSSLSFALGSIVPFTFWYLTQTKR